MKKYISGDSLSGCEKTVFLGENKKLTHRADYDMMDNKPLLPRDDSGLAISDTSNKANETGLIIRQPL